METELERVALDAGVETAERETDDCERGSMPLEVAIVDELNLLERV